MFVEQFKKTDVYFYPDYYRFKTHVLFDDIFEENENGNCFPTRYDKQLVSAVNIGGAYEKFFLSKKKLIEK
jgi:hypothetical protein